MTEGPWYASAGRGFLHFPAGLVQALLELAGLAVDVLGVVVAVIAEGFGGVYGHIADGLGVLVAGSVEQGVKLGFKFLAHALLHLCPGLHCLLGFLL